MSCIAVGNEKLGSVTLPSNAHGQSVSMSLKTMNQHPLTNWSSMRTSNRWSKCAWVTLWKSNYWSCRLAGLTLEIAH